ncbi:MAG: FAD-dependent oxidoreductase [Candidatus Woesearchaeota archaeon]|nr:FAD-dependent oxidoreductase [Candidatus Woesearchaeota archaeon]
MESIIQKIFKRGGSEEAGSDIYDMIIIGAGPAAFSAAIYSARYKLKTIILGKEIGGMISEAPLVENYPGFESIRGFELMQKFKAHAEKFGIEIRQTEIVDLKKGFTLFIVTDHENNKYKAKTIIFATGTEKRKLNIPGEEEFSGKGISYCATCDAPFYKDKVVCVVGGNESSVKYAIKLAEYASKAYIIYRGAEVRAEPALIESVRGNEKIEIITNAIPTEIKGTEKVESIILDNGNEIKTDGVFIAIGGIPSSIVAKQLGVDVDESGQIKVNDAQATNIRGIFAAGDVTNSRLKQVVTAVAAGAVAADSAFRLIKEKQ